MLVVVLGGIMLLFVVGLAVLLRGSSGEEEREESLYEKRPFVFDRVSELNFYKILLELFGSQYYIFPQIPYSRLFTLKKGVGYGQRTHFDKKVADFVLCDKERAVAQLVIELDGSSHNSERVKENDVRKDQMFAQIGLPILRLKTQNFDPAFIKGEVEKVLAGK